MSDETESLDNVEVLSGQDIDLEEEQPLPAALVKDEVVEAPKIELEIPFDSDPDMDIDQAEPGEQAGPLFGDDHWTQSTVHGNQPMTKEVPPNFTPIAVLGIPSMNQADITTVVEALAPVADKLGADVREWAELISRSRSFLMVNDQFAQTLMREDGSWRQIVDLNGVRMAASVPVADKVAPGTRLVGSDALIQMSRALGTYARMQFPLPHSGIWLNVAVPSGEELHYLEARLASAKYDLGWMSKGLVYSNTMVMQNIELVNFVLERVVGSNAEDTSVQGLKKVLRVTDLNLMAANMASAIYPSGFPLERPCSADAIKCHEVVRGTLRLSKIIWTDENSLSPWQKKHMQTRLAGGKKTAESLKQYQEEFVNVGQRVVEIAPGVSVRLLPPTIEQYEQSGYSWIDAIERSANQMLTTLSESQLNSHMTEQYQMTAMRQYAHWVDAIIYSGDIVVEGREEINESLQKASTETEVVNRFMTAIKNYIDECTVSLVAINNYTCPKCGKSQTEAASKNPKLIPLDAVHTFFTLSGLKTQTTLLKNMEH